MRTERLTESAEARLQLADSQAEALVRLGRQLASKKAWWGEGEADEAAQERTVIRCLPEGRGWWRVRVADAVGVIAVEHLQVVVGPKIPTRHLLHLMEKSGHLPRLTAERARITIDKSLWEIVAEWYTQALEWVFRRDLIKDYRTISDELQLARGHVDVYRTARAYYDGRLAIACEFDEFDADNPLNRLLRAAAARVSGSPMLVLGLRKRAQRLLSRMEHVGELRAGDPQVTLDRRTGYYSDALLLARHVLEGSGRGIEHGEAASWAFLVRTPEMVEEGIRRTLQNAFVGRWQIRKRSLPIPNTRMTVNPDLIFNETYAVGDVKYKLANDWVRADLYQVIAFAEMLGARFASVMSFRSSAARPLPILQVGDVEISHFTWNADPNISPLEAEGDFVASVGSWLNGVEETRLSSSRVVAPITEQAT